ncbi:beta-galactoside alpha-2,3-sialyltransferase [Klebsormidium nitens]|uniref:Beta-galactoside alpha-2,3-sialyltransferase n=1 Tax=Klebsormidium nitens TaxID=105231 RepID=A0A1Y1I397_KLENI|nr:beta-galactoside alpha-2,3-sialyltransferase [Klebsormidium nitens]|eukprot:GAQ84953.1 beta-galactoside alpha-2,3-sialyltransferase [Klebsormidium nitens]
MSLTPSGPSLPPDLWSTFAQLARQRLILAEPRLHERRHISCGGSGTVGFRSWQELARSIQEFDVRWPSEEPDLRALVARAQNTVPELERRPSCAVVGNSGRLLQHEHGAEIDKRDLVIRFNWGKTDGYEKHVGTKSHVRIYNGPYVSQKQPGEITLAEIRDPALREWVRKRNREEAEHAFAFDPEFLCHVWDWVGRSGEKPSTGLVGVVLALNICASVDVFGFHYEDYFDPNIQPHYYDWERPKVGREKAHPFEREYQLYQQLESARMLQMH